MRNEEEGKGREEQGMEGRVRADRSWFSGMNGNINMDIQLKGCDGVSRIHLTQN